MPSVALERMNDFIGNNAKAILLTVYGNRAYDDTLIELSDFLNNKDFCCIAAIAAVAEHSIMHQFATGRPYESDKKELEGFAQKIAEKINNTAHFTALNLPGNHPYRKYSGVPLKPKADKNCTDCGVCAKLCPVGAISIENTKKTDKNLCISCMRCIKVCPSHSRKISSLMLKIASKKMEAACQSKKENELFI